MSIECERKYLGVNFAAFRQNLACISAIYEGTNFESNSVWENNENTLMPSGILLRLRTLKWFTESNGVNTLEKIFEKESLSNFFQKYMLKNTMDKCLDEKQEDLALFDRVEHVLTLKMPANVLTNCKVREELEVNVGNAQIMQQIFCGAGFRISAWYEKIRESWTYNDLHIVMDLLPFAEVIEIEGDVQNIDDLAKIMNISTMEISTASYHTLHQKWRKQHNLGPDINFVFNQSQYSSLFV